MAVIEALIDADLIAYRCAATCEADPEEGVVLDRCHTLVERIIESVNACDYSLYLTGSGNFRKEIDPQYKANRKDKPIPKWLNTCREFLVTEWNARVTDGIEADDALGISQREDTYICSLDKDLLQIPGMHYNWVKNEEYYITEEQGLRNFWTQMLVGDVADNIFGIYGLGPVKTAKILDPIEANTIEELDVKFYETVATFYNDNDRLHRNAKLLWILRQEGGIWQSPEARIEAALKQSSPKSLKKASSKQSTKKTKSSTSNRAASAPIILTGQ